MEESYSSTIRKKNCYEWAIAQLAFKFSLSYLSFSVKRFHYSTAYNNVVAE